MSVTAVPLRPIARSALAKLWIGVGAAVLLAAGAAWWGTSSEAVAAATPPEQYLARNARQEGVQTTASGLQYKVLEPGSGARPTDADAVLIGYKGALTDGTVFDENPRTSFPVMGVVPGFAEGLKLMPKGSKYRLWIPPALGYGAEPQGDVIPANSLLVFDVEMIDFRSMAQIQAEVQQMQGAQGLPPGSAPPPPPQP